MSETEEIETALEGHRLDTRPPCRGHCQRCLQKNRKRLQLGVGERDRTHFADGEEVHFLAAAVGGAWRVRDVLHTDHEPPPFGDLVHSRVKQAYAVGNADREPGGLTLRHVTVERYSEAGAGPETPAVSERLDNPGAWVTRLAPEEPHPLWPTETREWLAELVEEHAPAVSAEASEEAV